jgi:sulfotransferase famil protein
MLISESKKFLFVHIQKTAGRSFEAVLMDNIPDLKSLPGTHDHAAWVKEELGDKWDEYYKVAFVRNPWDRLVSWYTMIIEKGDTTWYKRMTGLGKYNKIRQYVLDNANSFDDFICKCTATIADTDGKKSFWYNQLDYISDRDGKVMVDYIGRFENLVEDTTTVLRQLGIEGASLPHKNGSDHKNYRLYYNDQTKDLVAKRYARDIEYFGYEF